MDRQNRISWIDNARMFAMCCVVITHIKSAMGTPYTVGFSNWIVSFNMPLFVFLSSYMGYKALSQIKDFQSLLQYIQKMSVRIALPTFAATVIFDLIFDMRIGIGTVLYRDIAKLLLVIVFFILHKSRSLKQVAGIMALFFIISTLHSGYWFLNMLQWMMITFAVAFLIRKKTSVGHIAIVVLFIVCYIYKKDYVVEFFPYFTFGLLFKKYNLFDKINQKRYIWLPIFGISAICLFSVLYRDCYFYENQIYDLVYQDRILIWPFRILCGLSWTFFFTILFMAYSKSYTRFSSWGTLTLGIYLYHLPIFNFIMSKHPSFNIPWLLYWFLGFGLGILILAATTVLCSLFKRTKFTTEVLLGEMKIE